MTETVRVFDDGKFQYIGKRVSRLYDPYRESFPKGDIFRLAISLFDHGFNKYHRKRKRLYVDISFQRLFSIWKKLRGVRGCGR